MKKLSFIFAGILLLSVANASGQVFFGGNIGLTSSGGSTSFGGTSTDKTSITSFTFSPMVGYFLTDRLAVGGEINFSSNTVKSPGIPATTEVTNTFGLTPGIRYYAVKINKFSIFGQGYIGISWGTDNTTTGGNTVDGPTTTTFEFGFMPCISYDVTNKISLEANINLLNLSYSYNVHKQTIMGTEDKNTTSNFSFGAGVDNIVTTGAITIGAIIKL